MGGARSPPWSARPSRIGSHDWPSGRGPVPGPSRPSSPIGAALGLGLVREPLRGPAARAAVAAGAGLVLSWLAAANYLPSALSNPPAYAAVAAVSMAGLIGFGLTSFTGSLRLEAFGLRQVTGAVLAAVLGVGLLLQSVAAMAGTWGVGPPQERIPPAWTVVGGAANGPFRVLWLTGDRGRPPAAGRRSATTPGGGARDDPLLAHG